jgi:hypothetical protein
MRKILDRILRENGKKYNKKCFYCVVCGKSMDGIKFNVDEKKKIK